MSTLARPCPTCLAAPGDPCTQLGTGRRVAPHAARKGPRPSFQQRRPAGNREHVEAMRDLRPAVILRDGGCVLCGSRRDIEVHHRKPTQHGGPDTLANLVTLCGPTPRGCHGDVHGPRSDWAYETGLLFHSWDPAPTEAWKP